MIVKETVRAEPSANKTPPVDQSETPAKTARTVPTKNTVAAFSYSAGNPATAIPFAADLAILKLDFGNLFVKNVFADAGFSPFQTALWQKYRELFDKNVKNQEVAFNARKSTAGYVLGFPGSVNDNASIPKVGMVNLQINELIEADNGPA